MAHNVSLHNVLNALPGTFDSKGDTLFIATQPVFAPSVGKTNYVLRMLKHWEQDLLEQKLDVVSARLEPSSPLQRYNQETGNYEHTRPRLWSHNSSSRVVFQIRVPGSIITSHLTQGMGEAISGQAKKELALRLLEAFPPPFDPGNLPLAGGTGDRLEILGTTVYSHGTYKAAADEAVEHINQLLLEAGAITTEVLNSNLFVCYRLALKWQRDIYDNEREEVRERIATYLKQKFGHKPDVYFSAW